jgi:DNA-binding LacI/PurR family transcriptional regulator
MEIRLTDDRVEHLTKIGFPFVTIGRTASPEHTSWVAVDHGALVAACVDHLADLGHRRIALVNRSDRLLGIGYESAHRGLAGFRKAIAARGLTGGHYPCDDDAASGQACVERILRDDPATTALVTLNEAALGGLYRGLAAAGRAVPGDFSVTGVALTHWAETVTPQLTAADVPATRLGQLAVELLVERLADPGKPPRHHLLTPPISLRASTGPVRAPRQH